MALAEISRLELSVSILSRLERILVDSEASLLEGLRAGEHGLVLTERTGARGVFLPQVWEQLPQPAAFVAHLKRKAGLPADYWSSTLAVYRFTVQHFA